MDTFGKGAARHGQKEEDQSRLMDAVIEDMHRAVVTEKDDRNRGRRRQLILK